MSNKTVTYTIETEAPSNYLGNLLDFVYQKYILPQAQRFVNISRAIVDGDPSLTFTVLDSSGKQNLNVEIRGSKPVKVKIKPLDETVPEERINEVKQDVIIAIEFFEEKIRRSTLYFAWREGEEIVPEEHYGREEKAINLLFLETQILLFVVFISLGMFFSYSRGG